MYIIQAYSFPNIPRKSYRARSLHGDKVGNSIKDWGYFRLFIRRKNENASDSQLSPVIAWF